MRRLLPTLALLAVAVPRVAATEETDAAWKRQTIEFSHVSLTTAYSCELMEAKITMLLRHVGAADDIEVALLPCTGFDRPQTRHRITVTFSSLVTADENAPDTVKAAWTEIELGKKNPPTIDDGDCELLEAFQEHLLPVIEHEVIGGATGCSASKRSVAGRLRLEVLMPVAAPAAGDRGEDGSSE